MNDDFMPRHQNLLTRLNNWDDSPRSAQYMRAPKNQFPININSIINRHRCVLSGKASLNMPGSWNTNAATTQTRIINHITP
jgi:hypothetical protein